MPISRNPELVRRAIPPSVHRLCYYYYYYYYYTLRILISPHLVALCGGDALGVDNGIMR
jgi:hypothetical protein